MLGEIPPRVIEQCFIDVHQLHRWTTQQAVANLAGFGMLVPSVEECDDFIENVRRRHQGCNWVVKPRQCSPYVRIDVACENKWKAGREREKGSESTTNGRVSQRGGGKVSESRGGGGGGRGGGVGGIEMVSLSMEQALW